jgi:hypothetical protein
MKIGDTHTKRHRHGSYKTSGERRLPVLVSDFSTNLEVVSDPAHIFSVGNIPELTAKISALSGLRLTPTEREAHGQQHAPV